jgi:hypothetical protein
LAEKSKEIEGKYFLTLETLNPTLLVFSFPSLGMSITSIEKKIATSMVSIVFCCIWVLGCYFQLAIHLQKKTIEVKKTIPTHLICYETNHRTNRLCFDYVASQ